MVMKYIMGMMVIMAEIWELSATLPLQVLFSRECTEQYQRRGVHGGGALGCRPPFSLSIITPDLSSVIMPSSLAGSPERRSNEKPQVMSLGFGELLNLCVP